MSLTAELEPQLEGRTNRGAGNISFSFSDTIAGYVTGFDRRERRLGLRTSDGREFQVYLTPTTYGRFTRNLGEVYADATGRFGELLSEGQFLYAYGIFYQDGGAERVVGHSVVIWMQTECQTGSVGAASIWAVGRWAGRPRP